MFMKQTEKRVSIVFEDESLLVLNKPAGMITNRAESVKSTTMQDWFENTYPDLIDPTKLANLYSAIEVDLFLNRAGMVHRLDKDTSGVILWSKDPVSLQFLMEQFKARTIKKTYMALVHGKLTSKSDTIRVPLGRMPKNRKKFGVITTGKMTETEYRVVEEYQPIPGYSEGFSLLELFPKTGRTHQLRVVLKHLHHPIVGDSQYVGKKRAKKDNLWCSRQFLHAHSIEFSHPSRNRIESFKVPLAPDLKDSLSKLKTYEV